MKKQLKIIFCSLLVTGYFLFFINIVSAATASSFTVTDVPEANFYLTDTNKLIMDIALPDAANDGSGIECDGSTSTAVGACDAIAPVNAFLAISSSTLTAGGLMCTDSITVPTKIFRHVTSCTTDGTASGVTNYLGTAAISTAYISVSAASQKWAFRDTTVNSVYDAGEDIYIDSDLSLLYNADKLASVTVSNVGSAVDADLAAIRIYQESGTAGFDSSADTQIGSDTATPFLAQVITTGSSIAYVNGASVTTSNRRIYIAVDISNSPTVNSTIQARIIAGATTIAMSQTASANNGPTDAALTNTSIQAIRKPPEHIPPVSSITSPVSGATIEAGKNYIITGSSNDVGGSSVQVAEISFDNGVTWFSTTSKTALSAGFTWEYVWANPVVGAYTIKARATDWLGNREVPVSGISVSVAAPAVIISVAPVVAAPVAPITPAVTPAEPSVSAVIPTPTALTQNQIDAIISLLTSFGADQSVIDNIKIVLSGSAPATPPITAPVAATYNFTKDLTVGSFGADVVLLQDFLISKGHLTMPSGVDKGYFGSLTKSALVTYQKLVGISPAVGYFGPKTRAHINALGVAR